MREKNTNKPMKEKNTTIRITPRKIITTKCKKLQYVISSVVSAYVIANDLERSSIKKNR